MGRIEDTEETLQGSFYHFKNKRNISTNIILHGSSSCTCMSFCGRRNKSPQSEWLKTHLSFHSSGGLKSKVKVLAGSVPPGGSEGESVPCPSPSNPLMFLAGRHTALISACAFTWCSTLCVFPRVLSSSHKDIGHIEFSTHPNLYDLN